MTWLKRTLPLWLVIALLTGVWFSSSPGQMSVSGPLAWLDNGTNVFLTNSTRNVGIGTTGPLVPLAVVGNIQAGPNLAALAGQQPTRYVSVRSTTTADTLGFYMENIDGTKNYRAWTKLDTTNNLYDIGTTHAVTGADLTLTTAGIERVRVLSSTGNVGIGTTSPTNLLSFGGNDARTVWMERHTTADTAGNTLTVQAGGATSGATNKAGGNLLLMPGTPTGTGLAQVDIYSSVGTAAATTDNAPVLVARFANGHLSVETTVPTQVGCTSITGNDQAGKLVSDTTGAESCAVTFARTWTNAPACVVTNETTANVMRATSTVSGVTLAGTTITGDVLAYMCLGYNE